MKITFHEPTADALITIEKFIGLCDIALAELGYDRFEATSLNVRRRGALYLYFNAYDNFQENLPADAQVGHGYSQYISAMSYPELLEKLNALPNRRQREEQVLARRFAGLGEMRDHLTSQAGRDFVDAMLEMANAFALLTGPVEGQQDLPF